MEAFYFSTDCSVRVGKIERALMTRQKRGVVSNHEVERDFHQKRDVEPTLFIDMASCRVECLD